MALKNITETDLANKGVIGQPDSPQLSALEMQQKVEEVVRSVAIPAINQHATQLASASGAGEIGATAVEGLSGATVQAILNAVGVSLANKVDPETIDTINQNISDIVGALQMKVGSMQIKEIRINDDAMLEYTFDGINYAVLSGDGTPSVAGKGVVEIPLGTDIPPEQRLSNGLYLKEVLHVGPGQEVSAELQDNTGKPFLLRADPSLSGAVPTSRTVNGKPLSSNIVLAPADVGAVPTTRTVNGKALAANITLTPADVGAADVETGTWTPRAYVGSALQSSGTGRFVRHGKLVWIQFDVAVGSWTVSSGSLVIKGVPYLSQYPTGITVPHMKTPGVAQNITAYIEGDQITPLVKETGSTYLGYMKELRVEDFAQGASLSYCSGIYEIAEG